MNKEQYIFYLIMNIAYACLGLFVFKFGYNTRKKEEKRKSAVIPLCEPVVYYSALARDNKTGKVFKTEAQCFYKETTKYSALAYFQTVLLSPRYSIIRIIKEGQSIDY